jgi:hypothetical protein
LTQKEASPSFEKLDIGAGNQMRGNRTQLYGDKQLGETLFFAGSTAERWQSG